MFAAHGVNNVKTAVAPTPIPKSLKTSLLKRAEKTIKTFSYEITANLCSDNSANDLRHQISVEERAENVSFVFRVPRKVLLVGFCSVLMCNCSVLCHRNDRHAQVNTKRIHVEESKKRHHNNKVATTLPERRWICRLSVIRFTIVRMNILI